MSLTGRDPDERAPGPPRELVRGSPVPVRARDDRGFSPDRDAPPPSGSMRKFTLGEFQQEFGPCVTYTAPASPLRRRLSFESTIPLGGGGGSVHPRPAAAAGVPATLGRGGWRPVTGQFSLDSSLSPSSPQRPGDSTTLPWARKPLRALDNLPPVSREPPLPVQLPEPVVDVPGSC